MRRWIVRIVSLSILLSALAVSTVQAAPTEQGRFGTLESLSAYFPKDYANHSGQTPDVKGWRQVGVILSA